MDVTWMEIPRQAPSPQILWAVSAFDSNWLAKISSTPRSSLTTITLWERPTPSPASQPRRAFQSCTNSERLHSGRSGFAESKIQPLLRDQSLAGQFGPPRQNVRAIPRAVLARLAAHGFQPDLVCKSHWTAGKVGVRAHGAWDHEVFTRDLGWSVFQCVAVPLVAQISEMAVSLDRVADGHKSFILPRQERSSQTRNHGKHGRTRKGEVD